MATFINLTPHAINLNNGAEYAPSGTVCRIETKHEQPNGDLIAKVNVVDVQGLPEPVQGVYYIVSLPVLTELGANRPDLVSPATNHPETIRNDKGFIVSVPCFIRLHHF